MAKKKTAPKDAPPITITVVPHTSICIASPGSAPVDAGGKVSWTNHTGDLVTVYFPHDGVLGRRRFEKDIEDGETYIHPEPAKKKGSGEQRYAYAVYSEVTRNFAIGGSDPDIIVG